MPRIITSFTSFTEKILTEYLLVRPGLKNMNDFNIFNKNYNPKVMNRKIIKSKNFNERVNNTRLLEKVIMKDLN